MNDFDLLYNSLMESNTSGGGGVFGNAPSMNQGGAVGNKDFYEPNNAIVPKILGISSRMGKIRSKKSKKRK